MVKRTEFNWLKPYKPHITKKLIAYKSRHERGCMGVLAKSLNLDRSRLSNFINPDQDIDLTPTYVYSFLKGGFITVDELLRGKDFDKMSSEEQEFWKEARLLEDKELMGIFKSDPELTEIIKTYKRKGKNPKPLLKAGLSEEE